jgi:hypothetical protein
MFRRWAEYLLLLVLLAGFPWRGLIPAQGDKNGVRAFPQARPEIKLAISTYNSCFFDDIPGL